MRGPLLLDSQDLSDWMEADGIHIMRIDDAQAYGEPIRKAERTRVALFPHVMFLIDRIEASVPIKVCSRFRMGSGSQPPKVNVAAERKLVLRQNGNGMKFFQVSAVSGGAEARQRLWADWKDAEVSGDASLAACPAEERQEERASFGYWSEERAASHVMVYVMAMDTAEAIRQWHIIPISDRHWYAEPPSKSGGCSLQLADDGRITVRHHGSGIEVEL